MAAQSADRILFSLSFDLFRRCPSVCVYFAKTPLNYLRISELETIDFLPIMLFPSPQVRLPALGRFFSLGDLDALLPLQHTLPFCVLSCTPPFKRWIHFIVASHPPLLFLKDSVWLVRELGRCFFPWHIISEVFPFGIFEILFFPRFFCKQPVMVHLILRFREAAFFRFLTLHATGCITFGRPFPRRCMLRVQRSYLPVHSARRRQVMQAPTFPPP